MLTPISTRIIRHQSPPNITVIEPRVNISASTITCSDEPESSCFLIGIICSIFKLLFCCCSSESSEPASTADEDPTPAHPRPVQGRVSASAFIRFQLDGTLTFQEGILQHIKEVEQVLSTYVPEQFSSYFKVLPKVIQTRMLEEYPDLLSNKKSQEGVEKKCRAIFEIYQHLYSIAFGNKSDDEVVLLYRDVVKVSERYPKSLIVPQFRASLFETCDYGSFRELLKKYEELKADIKENLEIFDYARREAKRYFEEVLEILSEQCEAR